MNMNEAIGMNYTLHPNKGHTEHGTCYFSMGMQKLWYCNNNFQMVSLPKMEIVEICRGNKDWGWNPLHECMYVWDYQIENTILPTELYHNHDVGGC